MTPAGPNVGGFPPGTVKVTSSGVLRCLDACARELVSGLAPTPALRHLVGCLHPDDRTAAWALMRTARRRGSPFSVRTRIVGIDGLPRAVTLRAFPASGGAVPADDAWYVTVSERAPRPPSEPASSDVPAGARRRPRGIVVAMVDLDHFRRINSSFGQTGAEEIMAAVRMRLNRAGFSAVLPLEGDEFAVIERGVASTEGVLAFRDRITSVFHAPFLLAGDVMVRVTASVGIAAWPDGTSPTEHLMRTANAALDEAKQHGDGQAVVAGEDAIARERRRLTLVTELRSAVDRGHLCLFAQPQVEAGTGRVVAYEALVRWRRPGDGLVLPGEFIPAAERDGTITAIGAWVLTQACRIAGEWENDELGIAVNVSPSQLSAGFVRRVESTLSSTALEPRRLTLEITESAVVERGPARDVVQELRALGVRISLDDFGAGMTSLAQLSEIACDELKLDRSFVARLDRPLTSTITAAVVQIGRDMGAVTVCEGIESPAEYRAVRALGTDRCQGYLFGRPQPIEDIARRGSRRAGPTRRRASTPRASMRR